MFGLYKLGRGAHNMGRMRGHWLLFETMAQGAMYHDENGAIKAINAAAERILDTTASEMSNSDQSGYYWVKADGTRYQAGTEPWNHVLKSRETVVCAVMGFCQHSDKCRWISVNAAIFPKSLDQTIRVFTTFQDITPQIILQEELQRAAERQQNSLNLIQATLRSPKLEISEGYRIAETNIPAIPDTQICGDVYDSFSTKCGKHCVMIADVSGKGLESVDLAVATKHTIHAYGYKGLTPDCALALTNNVLWQRGESSKFVTASLLAIDPPSGEFELVRAGHEPTALYQPCGSVTFLSDGGVPLGIFPDASYHSTSHHLQKGGKIVLFTDGLSDARSPDGTMFFGTTQLERCLKAFGNLEAQDLLDKLVWCVKEWSSGKLNDDLTIVVIERVQD